MGMYFACMNTLALEWGFPCLPKIIKHTHTRAHKITHWSNATALCHHVHHDRSSICVMLASFPFAECIACVQCLATAAADSLLDATTVQLSRKAKKKGKNARGYKKARNISLANEMNVLRMGIVSISVARFRIYITPKHQTPRSCSTDRSHSKFGDPILCRPQLAKDAVLGARCGLRRRGRETYYAHS